MKVQEFLEHHGIAGNPFAEEDAQNDSVFKRSCLETTFHPAWDKIYGNPADPSTAVVFGEKGSGKTALKLQMVRQFERHNAVHPESRTFVVLYDDFNPFLDRFASAGPVEALGPHGRHPFAGSHATREHARRGDSRAASADPAPGPRPGTARRLLRPIHGGVVSRPLESAAAANRLSHLVE
jgi:hypothetical protein